MAVAHHQTKMQATEKSSWLKEGFQNGSNSLVFCQLFQDKASFAVGTMVHVVKVIQGGPWQIGKHGTL